MAYMTIPTAKDWVCQDVQRSRYFVAFNCDRLTNEPISGADILPITLKNGSREESETWSAGCGWYFVATEAGIILGRVGKTDGIICRKRSWRFLEAFI